MIKELHLLKFNLCILPLIISLLLSGCAASNISRNAQNGVDFGMCNARSLVCGDFDPLEAYQNSSQTTKGILLGGATGAVAGGLASSEVGVLPGLAIGAILGGALGAFIDANTTLLDRLENRGAKVIILGDQVLIVIPSARVFCGMSSCISCKAYPLLDATAQFLRCCTTKISVTIGAHSGSSDCDRVSRAVTVEQANSLVRYFWARGVNTRLLVGIGYGGSQPVSCSDWGSNYRIEIRLENLPTC